MFIFVVATAIWGKKATTIPLPRHFKWLTVIGYVIIVLVAQSRLYFARYKYDQSSVEEFLGFQMNFNILLSDHGASAGYILDYINSRSYFKEMPVESIREIENWSQAAGTQNEDKDSVSNKNLILIIVESLNTTAVEWNYKGRMAMPQLNMLMSDSSAITFTSVLSQVGNGESSDGQMLYYSGIYPSAGVPMALISPQGPYPSLAQLYPKNSFESIYEPRGTWWNHGITNKAFGFKRIYDDLGESHTVDHYSDSLLFAKAKTILSRAKSPFFSVITTIGTHGPYTCGYNNVWFSDLNFKDSRDKNYLEVCAAFDTALGNFINWMKKSGLWEKSIIVIASDHAAVENMLSKDMRTQRVIFTILNSGHTGFVCDKVVGQIDVFPTLIDIIGVGSKTKWHGFGHSLLDTIPGFAIAHDGSIVGDTVDKSKDFYRQLKAIDLSQQWIRATNKKELLLKLK